MALALYATNLDDTTAVGQVASTCLQERVLQPQGVPLEESKRESVLMSSHMNKDLWRIENEAIEEF